MTPSLIFLKSKFWLWNGPSPFQEKCRGSFSPYFIRGQYIMKFILHFHKKPNTSSMLCDNQKSFYIASTSTFHQRQNTMKLILYIHDQLRFSWEKFLAAFSIMKLLNFIHYCHQRYVEYNKAIQIPRDSKCKLVASTAIKRTTSWQKLCFIEHSISLFIYNYHEQSH